MGLFTKSIGTVFLKSDSQAMEYISKLKELREQSPDEIKEEIEKQIAITEYGIKGEEQIAFELKNSGIDMYILQDICIQCEGLSAQIDYMIVTRKRIYIIECKNLIGDIEINSKGDFIRTYQLRGRKIREGIYSPVTQNIRHLQVIKKVRKTDKGNFISRNIFENNFENNYKSIIVLANPKTILNDRYAKKEVKEQIVRGDQLIQKIRDMDSQVKNTMSEKEMMEVATFFLERNQKNRFNYAERYEALLEKINNSEIKESNDKSTWLKEDEIIKSRLQTELKAFRLERSRQEKIKPYFIFNDAQMEDLIARKPKSKEELCQISGFGKVKTEKYGEEILKIVNKDN